uniref:ATPase V1 complex subunit H C-terminal domain-containing protein n=1 Tax=Pseudo-nitzschia delicatissima TaxID=44447 RepID=A0A7S0XQ44_9STRA
MAFHPALSPSPLEKAFCYVGSQSSSYGGATPFSDTGDEDAENDLPPYWLSPPEVSLLRSAEENPLEYTLAEADDAVSYLRILLKMLNQVTVNASDAVSTHNSLTKNSRSVYYQPSSNNSNSNNTSLRASAFEEERILTLDTPMFSEDDAFDLYHGSSKQHKKLVVAHYCVTKIYEIICVSLDAQGGISSVSKLFHGRDSNEDSGQDNPDGFHTIHLENDEWRPLLKILYSRSSDEYTKRGSALILAYILNAGCEMDEGLSKMRTASQPKPDVDLLDLFSDEHKTTLSPSMGGNFANTNAIIVDTLQSFISWLTSRLQRSGSYASLGVVTPTLGVLMSTTKEARLAFVESGGIGYISRHLKAKRQQPPPSKRLRPFASGSRPPKHHRYDPLPITLETSPTSTTRNRLSASKRMTGATSPSTTMRAKTQKSTTVISNPFNSIAASISQSGSFGSSVSSNLGLSELDILSSLPSTENVNKNLNNIISSASEAAGAAAEFARSATPEGLVSFAASTTSAAMSIELTPPQSSIKPATATVSSSSVQQLYDLVFCLWCLSLDCSTNESVLKRFLRDGAVPALAHLLKKVPREKVLRMTLACLRSLSRLQNDEIEEPFVREMIGCGVLKSLDTVKLRRWNDADLEDDLELLQTRLRERTEELTQWSTYEAQITTGILRWDEMFHTQEFFRANARHWEIADFGPLKILVNLLYSNTTSGKLHNSGRADEISYVGLVEVNGWDEEDIADDEICETLAVCLYDIGEFTRHYPNGKAILNRIGAKTLIMQYAHHPRDMVREQALLCASKMLVKNWMAIER